MEIELGKRYVIKKGTSVFSIDLQQEIIFTRDVVVEPRQTFRNMIYFGPLIETSLFGPDYISNSEIEFGPDDVEEEYKKEWYIIHPPIIGNIGSILPFDLTNNNIKPEVDDLQRID